ncbi:MAG: molybdate ABC transporter substrate-binding protein [Gammaproteobacteria bacterium]
MKTLLTALLAALGLPAAAASLTLAAASDLTYTMDDLAAAFRVQEPGAEVKVILGASGSLSTQIRNGAPYDVFLSADTAYPARLAREGAADASTQITYAVGQAVVWSLDPKLDVKHGMNLFKDARVARVAIANPEVAPYGRFARAALKHHGVWDAVAPKLVIGENIAQTAQFVQTGNAQVGIVSLATVVSPRMRGIGAYFAIPADGLEPIEQGAIVTAHGKDNSLARRFMAFLRSPAARAILQRSGFRLPPE